MDYSNPKMRGYMPIELFTGTDYDQNSADNPNRVRDFRDGTNFAPLAFGGASSWATDKDYLKLDLVFVKIPGKEGIYRSLSKHTSDDFETDLEDNKWELIFSPADIGLGNNPQVNSWVTIPESVGRPANIPAHSLWVRSGDKALIYYNGTSDYVVNLTVV